MKLRNVVIVVAAAIALLIAVALLVDATMVGRTAYRPGHGTIGGHPLPIGTHSVGSIILIVLLGVLVLGGLALLGYLAYNKEAPPGKDETPLEIIERLYEGGQIDDKEFQRLTESVVVTQGAAYGRNGLCRQRCEYVV
ncbi:MAG: hypothetical protein JXM73_23305 [Anaerolineae bacterium]|nr:hypothetical protein [Anaerolineae bacterium]